MIVLRIVAALAGALLTQLGFAQTYPSKPVTLVVPFAAGGGTDIVARLFAERLREPLRQNVIVENRPGASAQIGNRYVVESPPDGHTLLVGTTSLINGPALFPKLPYDAEKQLRPVVSLADLPIFLAVSTKHDAKSVREFIEMAKKSASLNYASAGPGTSLHMSSEWLKMNGGFQATHIPFKGSAGAVVALAGGQVDFSMENLGPVLPMVQQNRVRLLAVASHQRHPHLPDVPTLGQSGLPEVNLSTWIFLMAPAATPEAVVGLLNKTANEILARREMKDKLLEQGFIGSGGSIEEMQKRMKNEAQLWGTVIRTAKITVE
jgi:tripartite-type tricarboxylate transporter receptor subunit TctC